MDMTEALAQSNQPDAIFTALEALVKDVVGAKLVTLMALDRAKGVARRSYSNMPDAYPTSGEKPFEMNPWVEQVVGRGETYVMNSAAELEATFPDAALIQSLGCASCINIPVTVAGEVIGTLNCLDVAGHYTTERVQAAEALKVPAALAFLVATTVKAKP